MKSKGKQDKIGKAVSILKKGGVIVYPTETVYGLGADILNETAVNRIYDIKGREQTKSVSIACLKRDIGKYAEVSDMAKFLVDNFLPGPVTLVLKRKKTIPEWITQSEYVGIRVPDNKTVQEILKKFKGAIVTTSANVSGKKDVISGKGISKAVREKVDLVIDEGETKYKGPSTVVQINGKVKILRHGVLDIWTKNKIC